MPWLLPLFAIFSCLRGEVRPVVAGTGPHAGTRPGRGGSLRGLGGNKVACRCVLGMFSPTTVLLKPPEKRSITITPAIQFKKFYRTCSVRCVCLIAGFVGLSTSDRILISFAPSQVGLRSTSYCPCPPSPIDNRVRRSPRQREPIGDVRVAVVFFTPLRLAIPFEIAPSQLFRSDRSEAFTPGTLGPQRNPSSSTCPDRARPPHAPLRGAVVGCRRVPGEPPAL
jgi:hypothetical protein